MEIPIGFVVEGGHYVEWVVIPYKKLYGLKYAGLEWFEKIKEGLKAIGFVQFQVDPCLWYR